MSKVIRYTKYGYEIYDTETMSYKMLDRSYTHVSDFIDGFAQITINDNGKNKYGYINEQGDEVVPAIYAQISSVYKGFIFALQNSDLKNSDSQWIIRRVSNGECFVCELKKPKDFRGFDFVRCVGEGVISTRCSTNGWDGYIEYTDHYKISTNGDLKPFLSCRDKEIYFLSNYSNGYALIRETTYEPCGYKRRYQHKKERTSIINKNGNVICKLHRNFGGAYTYGQLTYVKDSIYKFCYKPLFGSGEEEIFINITNDGEEYNKRYDYCDLLEFCGRRRVVRCGKWGYIDKDHNEIIECKYDKASIFDNGIAKVEGSNISHNGKWSGSFNGYIDTNGNVLYKLPPFYNLHYIHDLATFSIGNITATVDRGCRNYCRYHNAELYIPGFIAVDTFVKGVAIAVDQNNKCGIIDIGGNKLSEFIYDNIYDDGTYLKTHIGSDKDLFCSSKAWSVSYNSNPGNKYGYLARSGKVLIECEYDFLSRVEKGIVRGYKDNRLFIIDIRNNEYCYYTLNTWHANITNIVEETVKWGGICSFLSHNQKCVIVESVKHGNWRDYITSLNKAVEDYISILDLERLLNCYKIDFVENASCRPNKDDICEIYLISHYEISGLSDNGDIYLKSLLSYKKVLFAEDSYTAYHQYLRWVKDHLEEYKSAKDSLLSLTEERKMYFKQRYSKEEHRKVLVRHIHNGLKKKAIAEEIKKWTEPYKNMVK